MGPLRAVAGSFLFVLFLGFGAAAPSAAQPGEHAMHRQPPPVVVTGAPTPAPEATSPSGAKPSASPIATLPVEVGPGGGDYQPGLRTDPTVEAPFGPGSAGTSPPPDSAFTSPTIPNGTEGAGGGQGALPISPTTTTTSANTANPANPLVTVTATTDAGATPSPKSAASTPAGPSRPSNPSSPCPGEAECAGRSPAAKPGPQPEGAASVGAMAAVVGSVVVALGMAAAAWRRQTWRRRAQRDTDTDTGLARQVAQDASAT